MDHIHVPPKPLAHTKDLAISRVLQEFSHATGHLNTFPPEVCLRRRVEHHNLWQHAWVESVLFDEIFVAFKIVFESILVFAIQPALEFLLSVIKLLGNSMELSPHFVFVISYLDTL